MLCGQMRKRSPEEKPDPVQEAVRNVDQITDSEPADGEELLGSEKLKHQLPKAKRKEAERTRR